MKSGKTEFLTNSRPQVSEKMIFEAPKCLGGASAIPSVCQHYRGSVHRCPTQRLSTLQSDGRESPSYPAFAHTTERWACIAFLSSVCPHYRTMGVHCFPTQRLPALQSDGRASLSYPAFAHTTKRWACIAIQPSVLSFFSQRQILQKNQDPVKKLY